MKRYFDLHVFYSRKDGFSVPVEIDSDNVYSEDEVIKYAVDNNLVDSEDSNHVDYVNEIELDEYNDMKGIPNE